ncbi:MAG: CDP-alcohol phosphatidyltransferase family protein [Bacteroidetes bacterium]|nr:CDP-alcohol phosphatidyltransferase family protein [Bacteroidota bacterium]
MDTLRDRFLEAVHAALMPIVRLLVRLKVTPNALTAFGLLVNATAATVFILGAECGGRREFSYIGWGSGLILFAGLFDILDGKVARIGNMKTTFGGIFDSVIDRYSELIMFLGICYYLVAHHYLLSSLFAFIAMIGSVMVSYTRARAEAAGLDCHTGLMQRPARILVIGLSGIACSLVAASLGSVLRFYVGFPFFPYAETIAIFTFPIAVVAVLSNITAIGRLLHCRRQLA